MYGKAPPSTPLEMLKNLPPELLEEMLKDAPPEVAAMLRNMPPGMLEIFMDMGGFDDFEDEEDFFR